MNKKYPSRYTVTGRLRSFREYCVKQGYELLSDDYRFIDNFLGIMPKSSYKPILERYIEEWCEGMVLAETGATAQNEARRRANQWILNYKNEVSAKAGDWSNCFD